MKTLSFLLGLLLVVTQVSGQETEKSINGRTYVYTCSSVHNKANFIDKIKGKSGCPIGIEELTPIEEEFKKVLSKERVAELPKSIGVAFFLDREGNAKEPIFMHENIDLFTMEEIYALEDVLIKNYRIKITGDCPEQNYFRIMKIVKLDKIY
jgi:hypothetical protein